MSVPVESTFWKSELFSRELMSKKLAMDGTILRFRSGFRKLNAKSTVDVVSEYPTCGTAMVNVPVVVWLENESPPELVYASWETIVESS